MTSSLLTAILGRSAGNYVGATKNGRVQRRSDRSWSVMLHELQEMEAHHARQVALIEHRIAAHSSFLMALDKMTYGLDTLKEAGKLDEGERRDLKSNLRQALSRLTVVSSHDVVALAQDATRAAEEALLACCQAGLPAGVLDEANRPGWEQGAERALKHLAGERAGYERAMRSEVTGEES